MRRRPRLRFTARLIAAEVVAGRDQRRDDEACGQEGGRDDCGDARRIGLRDL